MKLLFASDLHGDVGAVKELLTVFEKEKADRLVLLGDLLYHGPRNDLPSAYDPKGVIALLNAHKDVILAVRGNCDTEVDQMVLDFDVLSDSAVIYDGNTEIFATHGHKYSPENPPKIKNGAFLLGGHTHVAERRDMGSFTYINPGSVSIPKENSQKGYIFYESRRFDFCALDGKVYRSESI